MMSAPIVRKRSTICVEKFVIHPKRVAPHVAVAATNAAPRVIVVVIVPTRNPRACPIPRAAVARSCIVPADGPPPDASCAKIAPRGRTAAIKAGPNP